MARPWLTWPWLGCTRLAPSASSPRGSALAFLLGTLTCATQQVEFGLEPLLTNFSLSKLSDFHRKCLKEGKEYLNIIKTSLYINIINTHLSKYLPP